MVYKPRQLCQTPFHLIQPFGHVHEKWVWPHLALAMNTQHCVGLVEINLCVVPNSSDRFSHLVLPGCTIVANQRTDVHFFECCLYHVIGCHTLLMLSGYIQV